jgi:hypothetical protein
LTNAMEGAKFAIFISDTEMVKSFIQVLARHLLVYYSFIALSHAIWTICWSTE